MNRISENITKWKLDTSKLSKADKEVLEIVHFPTEIGYRQAAQRRVKKMKAGSQFVELQRINISDVSYNVTSKEIAKRQVARTIYTNQIAKRQVARTIYTNQREKEQIERLKYQKQRQHYYICAENMEKELDWILSTFSEPKPTASMQKVEVQKPKKELTHEQKEVAKEKFLSGEMDIKEIAKHLKVTQTLLKPFLKTL